MHHQHYFYDSAEFWNCDRNLFLMILNVFKSLVYFMMVFKILFYELFSAYSRRPAGLKSINRVLSMTVNIIFEACFFCVEITAFSFN